MLNFNDIFVDDTKYGMKIPKEKYLSVGLYPVIDQSKEQIAGYTDESEGIYCDVPAIIFGDHTRIIKYIDVPFFLGADGTKLLKIKDNTAFNCKYLYYALSNAKIPNTGYNRHFKWLKELSFNIPSIEKQREIADLMDIIVNLENLRKKQLEKLELFVKSRFIEMFGDQTNPLEWPIVEVQEVADIRVGVVIKPAQYYTEEEDGIKAFRSLNIGPMIIKNNNWVYFSEEGNKKNAKSQLQENDLLIVRSGSPGTACVVTKDYEGCNAVDIIIARPLLSAVNPYYLCAYTNFPHGKRQIEDGTGGAAQQHFNIGKYNKLKLMLPPIELQNKFEEFYSQVDKSKLAIQQSLDELETLKKSLMQQYFG